MSVARSNSSPVHALVRPKVRHSAVRGTGPQLEWVIVEGHDDPLHVSTFAGQKPRERPPAWCPLCGDRVTLKLGEQLADHAAHAAGATCVAQTPEGIEHLETKLHLVRELR